MKSIRLTATARRYYIWKAVSLQWLSGIENEARQLCFLKSGSYMEQVKHWK